MNAHKRARPLPLGIAVLSSMALSACAAPGPDVASSNEAIIAGTSAPSFGAWASLGAVVLRDGFQPLCSGTLLTNQHVLTAKHCVRAWDEASEAFVSHQSVPPDIGLDGSATGRSSSAPAEESDATTLGSGDYAIITLTDPMYVNGRYDSFANVIYPLPDSTLASKSVTCVGYGNRVLATTTTPQLGSNVISKAVFTLSAVQDQLIRIVPNTAGQIATAGDSGSSCFLNDASGNPTNTLVGVQSQVEGSGTDIDQDHHVSSAEYSSVTAALYSSPDAHRQFVRDRIYGDVIAHYTFAPTPPGATVITNIETPAGLHTENLLIAGGSTYAQYGQRSGFMSFTVWNPTNMFCEEVRRTMPLSGSLTVEGACLSSGLVPTLLGVL
jgi:hypothetical protein